MSILTINSSARIEGSNSRALTQYLVQKLAQDTQQPVVDRDLVQNPLPPMSAQDLVGVHGSHTDERESLQAHLSVSQELIDELIAADTLVVGVSMYNFGVPSYLKQWVDYICRAGVTFRYTAEGPEGLTGIKRAAIVTASGGTPIGSDLDYASGYIAQICHFIGIPDIAQINAGGSKRTPELVIEQGQQEIDALITRWQQEA